MKKSYDLARIIRVLYHAFELNCGMQTFWDGGFTVWIGDDTNGFKDSGLFDIDQTEEAAKWLLDTALALRHGEHTDG